MPCATVHLLAAGEMLKGWKTAPRRAPIAPDRPSEVHAFLHGALAPDMGFIPGVDRLVSECSHYLRPGDLSRNLLAGARTREETAFAWGWAHHALVDVEIHPVVGRAVGERLFGDRSRRVDALVDVATHVSLEVGLDATLLRTVGDVLPPPSRPLFPARASVRALARALAETYDVDWEPSALVRGHQLAVRLTRWWPRVLSLLPLRAPGTGEGAEDGRDSTGNGLRLPGGLASAMAAVAGKGSPARGFFRPEAPRAWFLDEVRERIRASAALFGEWVQGGLETMGNPNLETGGTAGTGLGHPATELADRKVAGLRRPSTSRREREPRRAKG